MISPTKDAQLFVMRSGAFQLCDSSNCRTIPIFSFPPKKGVLFVVLSFCGLSCRSVVASLIFLSVLPSESVQTFSQYDHYHRIITAKFHANSLIRVSQLVVKKCKWYGVKLKYSTLYRYTEGSTQKEFVKAIGSIELLLDRNQACSVVIGSSEIIQQWTNDNTFRQVSSAFSFLLCSLAATKPCCSVLLIHTEQVVFELSVALCRWCRKFSKRRRPLYCLPRSF